ncbi:cysteine hydrolase family protein [Salmonella enterica]|uniref:cysteine hydrolase family protein n=1 Tax=Salmonella enterica TaxID=28901 RepID=UPI0022A8E062|nr:isochorismatase family protein [Salmonella enterica]
MATALIVIDMQNFVTDRINQGVEMFPDNAISNMYAILEIFRNCASPVIHIRHHSTDEGSLLHCSSPLSQPVAGFEEKYGEPVFVKNTSSAFSSTGLFTYLKKTRSRRVLLSAPLPDFASPPRSEPGQMQVLT